MNGQPGRPWTGRRVLIALLLFFGVVAAVNAAMVWAALESWPGRSLSEAPREMPQSDALALRGARGPGAMRWTG